MPVKKAGDGNLELELWWALWPMGLLLCDLLGAGSEIKNHWRRERGIYFLGLCGWEFSFHNNKCLSFWGTASPDPPLLLHFQFIFFSDLETTKFPFHKPWVGGHRIFQWQLECFCKPLQWLYGPCTKRSISPQRMPSFLKHCFKGSWFTGIPKMEMTGERICFKIWCERYVAISPNWVPLCKSCSGLFKPWENFWFWAIM